MNVLDYFKAQFPLYPTDEDVEILGEMPMDSVCGLDCKCAIDSATSLINHVVRAYGPIDSFEHPLGPTLTFPIINAAVQVCVCYIRG